MKLLFVMRHTGYVRNFERVLRTLARRGHTVRLAFEQERPHGDLAERLAREYPDTITTGPARMRDDRWTPLLSAVAEGADYLRYRGPAYRSAEFLAERAARRAPAFVTRLAGIPLLGGDRGVLARMLRAVERRIPVAVPLVDSVRGYDLVLVTPLVSEPSQHDVARAARAAGVPVVLAVHSWDNLTNKGLVRAVPDRTYVWNETQLREAVELHAIPTERVAVVGAHSYDHWFEWEPSTSREEFCREVGLDPAHPFFLYLGSSRSTAGDERALVVRWLEAVRDDPVLRDVGVLVRPYPSSGRIWADNPLDGRPNVAVWPPVGADPRDEARKAAYFDSLFHAAVVVGLNTSGLIEAAIVGRPTYSVRFVPSQAGTLHFQYLLRANGGPLTVADSLPEHVEDLRSALENPPDERSLREFVGRFVRPLGLEVPAAPAFVDDLERFAAGVATTRDAASGRASAAGR